MNRRRVQIAVVGSSQGQGASLTLAEEVGRELAAAGAVLVCGGLGGVMEAAARGAGEAGGLVVGITPGYVRSEANPWIEVAIPSGLGHARNVLVVAAGQAVIALPGGFGTLSEIYLALKLGRPVVLLTRWAEVDGARYAENAVSAVREALNAAKRTG